MKWPWFKAPSTSKVVFLLVAFTACAAFLIEIAQAKVALESKDFMMLAVMAFSFYFAIKSPGGTDDTTPQPGTTTITATTQGSDPIKTETETIKNSTASVLPGQK